jgi:Ni,Fe-hydrogenase III large subunit
MINKYVDKLLPGLRGPRQTRLERREQLFMVRGMLVSTLEDPTIYIVAGDALSKLYSRLAEIFRLVELKRALIEKMDLVDRIYRDARELDWARTMAVDDSAQGSSKNS